MAGIQSMALHQLVLQRLLPTLWLKTGTLPVLTGSDQVRSVMFMFLTGRFAFKYSRLVLPTHLKFFKIGWLQCRTRRVECN